MRVITLLLLLAGLGGCVTPAPKTTREFRYACAEGKSFVAVYAADGKSAILRFPGVADPMVLPRAISGSGARYGDGTTTLWIKGRTGFIESGKERIYRDCRTD
ncbi:MAG: MliC family protein [Candidatus Tectomicrobia bacterium]|uniref:MliC family protein n=1 Tax=Tectimicrobiota bacterium TaxID=2528274 RepID=A0A932HUV1_UNCTE|nr:MliC family protein [Candidatus Tectomicrobia bacterium]